MQPPLPSESARPLPVFSILAYVLPAVAAIFGTYQGLRDFSNSGNDFMIQIVTFYGIFGMGGGAIIGIGFSLLAISRGETHGAKSLNLLRGIIGSVVVGWGGLWLISLL